MAEEHIRGRVIGLYASVGAAGFALGPLLLALTGTQGLLPFACAAVLIFVAAIPLFAVLAVDGPQAAARDDEMADGLWKVFLAAPLIMLANIAYGAAAESMITFFPLFGVSIGLTQTYSLGLMTIMALGSMICVLPLGWLADHVNRLGLLTICVACTTVALAVMPFVLQRPAYAGAFIFAFGGMEGMIYALAVILMGQSFKGMKLARASTAFTACWGAGTVIGPLLTGLGIDRLGAEWMAPLCGLFFALYLPIPLIGWIRSRNR